MKTIRKYLPVHTDAAKLCANQAARLFFTELLGSVETLEGITEQYDLETLVQIMYLHDAIGRNGNIEFFEIGTQLQEHVFDCIRQMPSASLWFSYIKIDRLSMFDFGCALAAHQAGYAQLVTIETGALEDVLEKYAHQDVALVFTDLLTSENGAPKIYEFTVLQRAAEPKLVVGDAAKTVACRHHFCDHGDFASYAELYDAFATVEADDSFFEQHKVLIWQTMERTKDLDLMDSVEKLAENIQQAIDEAVKTSQQNQEI